MNTDNLQRRLELFKDISQWERIHKGSNNTIRYLTYHIKNITERNFSPNHPTIGLCLYNLGIMAYEDKNYSYAIRNLEDALAVRIANFGWDNPETRRTIDLLILIYLRKKDFVNAAFYCFELIFIYYRVSELEDEETISKIHILLDTYRKILDDDKLDLTLVISPNYMQRSTNDITEWIALCQDMINLCHDHKPDLEKPLFDALQSLLSTDQDQYLRPKICTVCDIPATTKARYCAVCGNPVILLTYGS